MVVACRHPGTNVFTPGAMRTGLAGHEASYELLHGVAVLDLLALAMIVILRDDDVARIANDIHHLGIARLKAFVTLDDAWPCHPVKIPLGGCIRVWNQAMDVLKADGLLVISTPNRVFYTEERNDLNPFHTHEFDLEEFASCLRSYFKKVEVYYQNHVYSIFIGDPRSCHRVVTRLAENQENLESTSNFFVAVCSKSEQNWRQLEDLVYLPSTGNLLRQKEQRIRQLESKIAQLDEKILNSQKEYDERTQWCLELDRLIKNRDATIVDLQNQFADLQNQFEERSAWAHRLSQEITQKDAQILKLQREYEERTEWALRSNEKLERIKQSNVFRFSRALGLVPKV